MTDWAPIRDFLITHGPWVVCFIYVFFTALGHVRMTPEQAHAWPRLFSAVRFGQAIGGMVLKAVAPFLGMFSTNKAVAVVLKVFPPAPDATPATPPPANDAIPVAVDVPAPDPTPLSPPPAPPAGGTLPSGGRRA